METYAILRRSGWKSPGDLEQAAARSTAEGDKMPSDIRWIRSYVLDEADGQVGTVCIYQASSPEAIRRHSTRRRLLSRPDTRQTSPWIVPTAASPLSKKPTPEQNMSDFVGLS